MSISREVLVPRSEALNVSRRRNLPHSPGIRAGDFIFLSGMVSIDPGTGELSPGTVEHETHRILTNMQHMLESGGSSLERVVKVNILLHSMLELENLNAVYARFFPAAPPARTVCGVQLSFGLKVEIECIALAN